MPGIYLHIPYCVRKCTYCDFVSAPEDGSLSRYVSALIGEMRIMRDTAAGTLTYDTVFFGGGTPSLLSGGAMKRILTALRESFPLTDDAECSMEANPGTLTPEKLIGYREAGINRISIGLQSANDRLLRGIGRIHDRETFLKTVDAARDAGFDNINADVMHGLPTQTQAEYLETLAVVTGLGLTHISSYALIVNDDTPLGRDVKRGRVVLPDADETADMEDAGIRFLAEQGYRRYEISNFARDGRECRHNLNYWRNGEYLGLGAAAHSAIRDGAWTRFSNVEDRRTYIGRIEGGRRAVAETLRLQCGEEMFETVMLGLRLTDGIEKAAFAERFGVTLFDAYPDAVRELYARGWSEETETHFRLNGRGLDLQNEALLLFLR